MPVNQPPTITRTSMQPAPVRQPQIPAIPTPTQLNLQTFMAVLQDIDQQLATLVKQSTPADAGPPQGALVIDSVTGTVVSDVIQRADTNLVVEVFASGSSPSATITVLDCPIGGTPQQAADGSSVRVLTSAGYYKYYVGGIQDEIQIKVAPTAGTWSVRVSFSSGQPISAQAAGVTFASISGASDPISIVSAVAGKSIVVVSYVIVSTSAQTAQWQDTNGTNLSGAMALAANGGLSFAGSPSSPAFQSGVGFGIRLHIGGATQFSGHLGYLQQ